MFEKIFNSLKDGLIVFDEKNKVSLINTSAKKMLKIDEKILGKSIEDFFEFPDLKNLFFLLGKEIREVFRQELEVGKLILEVSSFPILEKGKKFASVVVLHDITKEKAIERLKSEFISISAHQLRTPLVSMRWGLESLLKEKIGPLNVDQQRIVKKVLDSLQRMLKLFNDLLSVLSIEEGKYSYEKVPTDFENLVNLVINFFKEKISEKQLQFEFRVLSKKLPKIKIDSEKMSLVIQTLLDNAIRYNLPRGLIIVSLQLRNNEIEFSVKDTGIGIPKREQENIFQKFFRASNAIKKEPEGSGLSLFLAKNIVEAHQGKIWFESQEEKGTTFFVKLPVK